MVKKDQKNTKIEVDLRIYPLEAIYGASYVFIDRAYIYLDIKKSNKVEISINGKKEFSAKTIGEIKGEFMNELLNYSFRVSLAKENKKRRDYMVEKALFASTNNDDLNDQLGYDDDPLGIAVPWEEKYGKKN